MSNILHLILADIHLQSFIQVTEHVCYSHHNSRLIINYLLREIRPNGMLNTRNDCALILLSEYLLFGKF
jgi:hypothetical protein